MRYAELEETYGFDPALVSHALSRAWTDMEYRDRMLMDAKAAFAELGVVFPDNVRLTVHEFDPDDRHYFLPPRPVPDVPGQEPAYERPEGGDGVLAGTGGTHYSVARVFMLGNKSPSLSAASTEADPEQGRW